jgi:fatty acid-binding protein DegV
VCPSSSSAGDVLCKPISLPKKHGLSLRVTIVRNVQEASLHICLFVVCDDLAGMSVIPGGRITEVKEDAIRAVHNAIPNGAIDAEQEKTKHGSQQSLI